ncbi:hypothetical protein MTR_5g039510 [Medicago truncatula]|uniref:Putative plant transposon protein domain-containing protein n=1 Tax=Medicago truncatula TaxID=3880 RepID=G7KCI6_MEDTR|nr:hypothetical protein MTR_5g039510 [Medicago truncatula]
MWYVPWKNIFSKQDDALSDVLQKDTCKNMEHKHLKDSSVRNWENFHSCIKDANKTWVREFYSNASSTVPEFESMVRGANLKLSGAVINSMLGLTAPPECWVEKMRAEQLNAETYDMLLNALCKPGAGTQWVLEKENNKPKFLRLKDLNMIAQAWSCFYHASVEVCSTNYQKQLLVKNAFVVYALLKGKPINLGRLIADSISYISKKDLWLGHSSIIHLLCVTKGVSEEPSNCIVRPTVIDKSWFDSEVIKDDNIKPQPDQQPESFDFFEEAESCDFTPYTYKFQPQPTQSAPPQPDQESEPFDFTPYRFKFQPQPTPPQQNVQLFTMVDERQLPNCMHNSHEWMGYLQNYHNRNKKRISREQFFDERYGIPPPEKMPSLTYFPPPYPQADLEPPHQEGDQPSGLGVGLGAAQELNFNHSSFGEIFLDSLPRERVFRSAAGVG